MRLTLSIVAILAVAPLTGCLDALNEEEKEIFSQVANSAFRNSELFEIFTPNQTYTSQVKETVLKILGTN